MKRRQNRNAFDRRQALRLVVCAVALVTVENAQLAFGQWPERRNRSDSITEPQSAPEQQARMASAIKSPSSGNPGDAAANLNPERTSRSGKIRIPEASPVKTFGHQTTQVADAKPINALPQTSNAPIVSVPASPPLTPPSLSLSDVTPLTSESTNLIPVLPATATPIFPTENILPAQTVGYRQNPIATQKNPPITNIPTVSGQSLTSRINEELNLAREQLLHRACYSARDVGWHVLEQLSQLRSDELQTPGPATALLRARMNMREAGDFLGRYGTLEPKDLQRLVEAHETSVLKNVDLNQVTANRAADVYYETARKSLLEALAGQSLSAEALTVVADSHLHSDGATREDRAIAITCLRAAIGLKPTDAAIANQLGFELLKDGRLDESEKLIKHALNIASLPEAWQNLAEIHRRRGELPLAQQAAAMAQHTTSQSKTGPIIEELSPQQFAQLSPRIQWPNQTTAVNAQYPGQPISGPGYAPQPAANTNAPTAPLPISPPNEEPGRVARFFQGMWR